MLLRADGVPTYNFGVVVDDIDMDDDARDPRRRPRRTTRRARSTSTARSAPTLPQFGHVPMILGADGERLSKRHGAVSVMQYRDDGFLPEAMVNYLARLGWSHGDEEVFSREQLVRVVRPRAREPLAARWDPEKLKWIERRVPAAASRMPALAARLERDEARGLQVRVAAVMDPVAMTAAGQREVPAPRRPRALPRGDGRASPSRRGDARAST